MLTKRWVLILLSKLSEHYAILKKIDKKYTLILVSRDV